LDEKNWFTSETKAAKTSTKAAENRDQQNSTKLKKVMWQNINQASMLDLW
jgi:hypothetical protein